MLAVSLNGTPSPRMISFRMEFYGEFALSLKASPKNPLLVEIIWKRAKPSWVIEPSSSLDQSHKSNRPKIKKNCMHSKDQL